MTVIFAYFVGCLFFFFFFQAEDGIRDLYVTGVQTCALPISSTRSEHMKVGQGIEAENAGWNFGGKVPDTFVDHIVHSVPLYKEGHDLICQISDFFCGKESVCYELGVSTGELIRKLAEHHKAKPGTRWVGLDVEGAMVEKARSHCAGVPNVELHN